MIPDDRDKVMARLLATWPTPKLPDPTYLVWCEELDQLDFDQVMEALQKLTRTCERRPSLAKLYETIGEDGGAIGGSRERVKFYGTRWTPDDTSHGRTLVSPLFESVEDVDEWVERVRTPEAVLDKYRRDYSVDADGSPVAGTLKDHPITEEPPVDLETALSFREQMKGILHSMAAQHRVMTQKGPLPEPSLVPERRVPVGAMVDPSISRREADDPDVF